jgi:hypothetical protein
MLETFLLIYTCFALKLKLTRLNSQRNQDIGANAGTLADI